MPFTYRIDPEKEYVEVRATGALAVADLIAGVRDLIDDPGFDPLYDMLVDCRGVEIATASFGLIEAVSEITQGAGGGRRAIVQAQGPQGTHAARFVELRNQPDKVRLFTTRRDAERWLGTAP
jgi:hypothetical protein